MDEFNVQPIFLEQTFLSRHKHAALRSGDGSPINASFRLSPYGRSKKEHDCRYKRINGLSFHKISFGFPNWLAKICFKVPIRLGNSSVGNSR
jgi:hypothetical protein